MNAGYFTKDNLSELVNWFQVGESVYINQRYSCGMACSGAKIRREGDKLIRYRATGFSVTVTNGDWTPTPIEANRIVKLLRKNRQRRKSERDRLAKLDIQ